MSFADGFSFYAWKGVRIPARYFEASVSAGEILKEDNAEVRRALIERYDQQREKGQFIQDVGAKVIDSAIQPMRAGIADSINELLSLEMPGDPDGRMMYVKMVDPSTGRVYMNRVHPELRPLLGNGSDGRPLLGNPQVLTVRNALASTHGLRGEEYVLLQES
jgi:hypothetical protein